ncbi:hypothetical protein [Persicitalea sp.]|uniref:hypothetical protein n=1 Tax=Persicitalea sp. TaxID=3100273 RepID=UPI0035946B53
MKNTLLILGLIGSATAVSAQTTPQKNQIVQQGNNNVFQLEVKGTPGDTLPRTRVITQNGTNQILIDTTAVSGSAEGVMENVAVEQRGKKNVVAIETKGGKGNSVQVTQSGSGNTVSIKQN